MKAHHLGRATIMTWAMVFACAGTVHGDVTTAYYDGLYVEYEVIHMSDLDQKRTPCDGVLGLANNGSQYCVPTSAMNLCNYAANHGFPEMSPGPANMQAAGNYGLATVNIAIMGAKMQTDPFNGSGGEAYLGLQEWIFTSGLADKLNVHYYYISDDYTPSAKRMSLLALSGHVVSFAYGRYNVIGEYLGYPLLERTGGHMVTLRKSSLIAGGGTVWCRDPADVPYDCEQLAFTSRVFDISPVAVALCQSLSCIRILSAIDYPSPDGGYRMIDGYMTISPKAGFGWTTGGWVLIQWPYQFPSFPIDPNPQIDVGGLRDLILDPDELGFFVIGEANTVVYHYDLLTTDLTPVVELGSPRCMAIGPDMELYVVEDDRVARVNPRDPDAFMPTSPLPVPGDAVMWDGQYVRVLSVAGRQFIDYFPGLPVGVPPMVTPIPDGIPMEGEASLAQNPVDGMTWFVTQGSPLVFGLSPTGDYEMVEVPGMTGVPTGLSFDDTGRMFVTAGGQLHELVKDDAGHWRLADDPQFDAQMAGDHFMVTRSRTNYDPDEHSGPPWYNIDPSELDLSGEQEADCIADMDGDGMVGIADLLSLLAAWGDVTGFEPADIEPLGGDGVVDVSDLLRMLAFWGPCD